jgi:hypothetical protein
VLIADALFSGLCATVRRPDCRDQSVSASPSGLVLLGFSMRTPSFAAVV